MPVMQSVYSSSVNRIGYEGQELYVEWASGKTSVYSGVPADVAAGLAHEWSVGRAIAALKGSYPHRYLQEGEGAEE